MGKTKAVNFQGVYNIPVEYVWVARNQTGVLNGFVNPPIRDFETGEWQDSVTGDYGYFIPFDSWDRSVRKVDELTDTVELRKRTNKEYQNPNRDPAAPRCKRFQRKEAQNG